jgi:hypothetical protein
MVKMTAWARYGLASKAPTLRDLEDDRKAATLLATVRHTGVEVAGLLDDFVTDSGFVITPVVTFGGRQQPVT